MKHTLILSALLLGFLAVGGTAAYASEVVGTLSMGSPASTGSLSGTVTSASSGGGSGGGSGSARTLGGGITGLGGAPDGTLALTSVVTGSGSVLGAQSFAAPATVLSAHVVPAAHSVSTGAVTLATTQDTSNLNSESVAAVAMSTGGQRLFSILLALLVLLGLGYYLFARTARSERRIP